jgi:hypothetical protein
MKDQFVKLRVSAEERESWQRSANVVGLSLSAYVRRCVDEAQALENVLEAQVEQERVRQKRHRLDSERVSRPQRRQPSPRPHRVNGYRGIGDALAAADALAGFRRR